MKHMHVLQLGYKVAYVCNLNWTKYAALLQHIFGAQVQKPQMLVETRWGYVLKNMRWLLEYASGVEQEKLFECSQRMVQALESSAVERGIWDEQHVPVAGRMKPKPTDGKAASRGRQKLLRTSANCLFIARRALATCAQHYTFESMAAIRKKCRPKQAKRKRADDGKPYLAEHNRKTEHWSGRERTQSRDTLQHKAVAIVMTKKLKEDTDVEQLHTNAVKVVFKERKLDQVYHFMDPTTQKRVCASSTTQPAFMELVQDWLDANDQSGEVRQQCIEQHKKDADAKANAKSAKHAAAMAAMVTNTDAT